MNSADYYIHAVRPALLFPEGHFVQEVAAAAEYVPPLQVVQLLLVPPEEAVPARQVLQTG